MLFRNGVGVTNAFGTFFLCDLFPVLVRCGIPDAGAARTEGVVGGGGMVKLEVDVPGGARASCASKSERWFMNVF